MKRMRITLFLVLGLALPSTACLTSLHPWFTQADLVFEPGLVGTWVDASDSDTTWVFTRRDDTTYTLVDTRNESHPNLFTEEAPKPKRLVATQLKARLMRLGDARYLDICAGDEWTDSSMLQYLLVNSHLLFKVRLKETRCASRFSMKTGSRPCSATNASSCRMRSSTPLATPTRRRGASALTAAASS